MLRDSSFGGHFPLRSHWNIANHFSLLCEKPVSQRCIGDMFS